MRHLAWLKPIVVTRRCAYWRHLKAALFGVCLSVGFGSGLAAATFEAGGLSFSDELGGFRLLSASGRGTASDPIILVEEITSLKPAVLTVRPIDAAQHESASTPSLRVLMRSVIKVVVNKSAWRWTGFDLELRGEGGQASIYSDGLSFDQLSAMPTPFHSDLFASIRAEDEPHDRLRYDQGHVEPQQTVQIAFNLMDLNPRSLFYVAQEPIVLLTEGPTLPNVARPIYAGFAKPLVPVRHRSANFPISP
jgi:hypothetical protein